MMQIQSHSHPYTVEEFSTVDAALAGLGGPGAFVLVDAKVAELYRKPLSTAFAGEQVHQITATEHAKSYEQLAPVFCWLLERRCQRSSHLVVIGGGVLQDIGCFIASVLMRGIRWTLVPTTLLAQCDSCIGSKSSLNIGKFKNQLGTFYAPHEVRLAPEFLGSLSEPEILSGLGEAIKLHLIAGAAEWTWLRTQLPNSPQTLPAIIRNSLQIKQRFIEVDEFDRGIRNLLNYGHTFAHAFESATSFAIPHGIAVTLGVACATLFSEQLGMISSEDCDALVERLQPYFGGYAATLAKVPVASIVAGMKQDKKNVGNQLAFILTRGPGRMEKVSLEPARATALLVGCIDRLQAAPYQPQRQCA
ncbi:MAG TPA: hypothetical protein VG713_19270 [Pirellulales bacterium]|nr:hypothetical protein [Pirellulales bacterium]